MILSTGDKVRIQETLCTLKEIRDGMWYVFEVIDNKKDPNDPGIYGDFILNSEEVMEMHYTGELIILGTEAPELSRHECPNHNHSNCMGVTEPKTVLKAPIRGDCPKCGGKLLALFGNSLYCDRCTYKE